MRINHNLMAMNTNRQLGIANKAGSKSMEKLSSGFRINRAADDAAGLSISEKMRNQIRGLERASANSQDGISLIQTAEGALDETHAILKRMRELTVQAGNEGTQQSDDLESIKDEFAELAKELDGIADRTEFNGKKLLDGSYKGTIQIGANQGQQLDINVAVTGAKGESKGRSVLGATDVIVTEQTTKEVETKNATVDGFKISGDNLENVAFVLATADTTETTAALGADGKLVFTVATEDTAGTPTASAGTDLAKLNKALEDAGIKGITIEDAVAGTPGEVTAAKAQATTAVANTKRTITEGGSLDSKDLGVKLSATALEKKADGTNNLEEVLKEGIFFGFEGMSQNDVKTATDTNLERLDAANKAVSKVRSHLGANQNRLEHTIKNLDNAAENIQASESRIRDVDMAKEMIENTKQNILQQASTAMLAQANQAPQSVLRLLG